MKTYDTNLFENYKFIRVRLFLWVFFLFGLINCTILTSGIYYKITVSLVSDLITCTQY